MILSGWIFGFLLIGLTGAHGSHHFPDHFIVAKRNQAVTLTCDPNAVGDVTWKFEGKEIEDDEDEYKLDGPNLNISDIESPMLGNYICLSGDKILSSTHLLLEAEEEDELDSFLKCWANSYDCTFNCTWTKDTYDAVRLGLGNDCSEGRKSCQWVTSGAELPDGGFQFVLSHSLSPYAEETTMLELTAEAITDQSILRRTKRFYLRDIIQPDSPQIVRCQVASGGGLNVTIDPPSSWSSPHSFFSLEHEIEYRLRDDGREITVKDTSPVLIDEKISMLRVRSRDSLVLSNWSQWTPWKNIITKKKKLCLCINTTGSCCPELTSEFMDRCKREKEKKKRSRKGKGGRRNQTP